MVAEEPVAVGGADEVGEWVELEEGLAEGLVVEVGWEEGNLDGTLLFTKGCRVFFADGLCVGGEELGDCEGDSVAS